MLSHLDEHFYHQVPTPVDFVTDSDPRFVDQHWFQAMDLQGRFIVGANWPVFPNNNIVESGQIIVHGDTQYNLRYQRRWKQEGYQSERTNLRVGPCFMEVIEPFKRARFVLEPDNEWGISYDLTMETLLKPVETRTPIFNRRKGLPSTLPYFQNLGKWTGFLKVDGVEYKVTPENCWGQRDRCWATLGGERFQGWLPPMEPSPYGRIHWHSHIQFDDIGFWWWLDEQVGRPRLNGTLADSRGGRFDGAVTWRLGDPREQIRLVDFKDYDLEMQPGTTKFASARCTVVDDYGTEYPLSFRILAPNATRHIRGEGYGDPVFLGGYNGEFYHQHDKYNLADFSTYSTFSPMAWDGEHAVECRLGDRVGIGHMEISGTPPLPKWGLSQPLAARRASAAP